MKPGDLVKDKIFGEIHRIITVRGKTVYVQNKSGPGSYEGRETWLREEVIPCQREKATQRRRIGTRQSRVSKKGGL